MGALPRMYDYLIALGSNMRHHRHGRSEQILRRALKELGAASASRIISTAPLGPSQRRYANAAALVSSALPPDALLKQLQALETTFGRRRRGQRWSARVLDLDIVLWSGGAWSSPGLTVPHIAFRARSFVLRPAAEIVPRWRDPLTGLTVRQLSIRLRQPLTRKPTVPKRPSWSGP